MKSISILDLYSPEMLEDEDEALFHFLPEGVETMTFEVLTVSPEDLAHLLVHAGDMTVLDAYHLHADPDQRDLVSEMREKPDPDRVIVTRGGVVLDGNHHLVASYLSGRTAYLIDLDQPKPCPENEETRSFDI